MLGLYVYENSSKGILLSVGVVVPPPPLGGGGVGVDTPALPPPLAQLAKPITITNIATISRIFFNMFAPPSESKSWTTTFTISDNVSVTIRTFYSNNITVKSFFIFFN